MHFKANIGSCIIYCYCNTTNALFLQKRVKHRNWYVVLQFHIHHKAMRHFLQRIFQTERTATWLRLYIT